MKFKIQSDEFANMVATAAQAISSKPMLPAYECVYVRVSSESGSPIMTILGKDAGIAIMKSTDRIVAMDDGEALIPAKTLLAFLKLMDGEMTVEVDSRFKCQMKCGAKKTAINCMDASDFASEFAPQNHVRTVRMTGDDFEKMVMTTLHCVSTDESRMALTGIHFAFDAETGICEAVTLDGFRVALARKPAESNDTFEVTIPSSSAKLIAKTVKGRSDISFRFGSGTVIMDDFDTSIEASLLSGDFIAYKHLINRDSKMQARVNTQDMMEATKLCRIAADAAKKELILLNFEHDGAMRVTANCEMSEAVIDIPCDTNGKMDGTDVQEIAFNGRYIEDAMKASEEYAGEVTLLMNTTVGPMAIVPVDRDDYYQLVLPVRRLSKD